MAGIGLNSLKLQMGAIHNLSGQVGEGLWRFHAAAAHTHFIFHQAVNPAVCKSGGLLQVSNILGLIHAHGDTAALGQPSQPGDTALFHYLVGHQNILNARHGQVLRFADLGAADSLGPGLDLQMGDGRAFMGLVVGPQSHAGLFQNQAHPLHVPIQSVPIHQQRRGFQTIDPHKSRSFLCRAKKTERQGRRSVSPNRFGLFLGLDVLVDRLGGCFAGAHSQDNGGRACDGVAAGIDALNGGLAGFVRLDAAFFVCFQAGGALLQNGVGRGAQRHDDAIQIHHIIGTFHRDGTAAAGAPS